MASDGSDSAESDGTLFQRTASYLLQIDGEMADDARFYQAKGKEAGLLITSAALPKPVWMKFRAQQAMVLRDGELPAETDEAMLHVPSTLAWDVASEVKPTASRAPSFQVDGRQAVIGLAPPLAGTFTGSEILEQLPLYAVRSAHYAPADDTLQALASTLRASDPLRLEVYFSSTCSHCEAIIPKLVAVENALGDGADGGRLEIVYHGLDFRSGPPQVFVDKGIEKIPAAHVHDAETGAELARVDYDAWSVPEQALLEALQTLDAR